MGRRGGKGGARRGGVRGRVWVGGEREGGGFGRGRKGESREREMGGGGWQ